MNRIAIYPGSFDPFTNGHLDIVKKAAELFETVYVIIGVNVEKKRTYPEIEMVEAIRNDIESNGVRNCIVCKHYGLVAEFAKEVGAGYMIRGLRNNMDYYNEESKANANKMINPDLEYVYFRAENAAVSSSMVREFNRYGKDVSMFVPENVHALMLFKDRRH